MRFYSLKNYIHRVTFEEAIINSLAPDKGLYFPESIPLLSKNFLYNLSKYNIYDIAFKLIHPFIGDTIPDNIVYSIVTESLRFPFPIQNIDKNIYALELYQGPTMAFKDVGAKFMAGCLGYFMGRKDSYITVLVATSGDTGGAVANGFFKVKGIKVIILFPSKRVSKLQEKQLTNLGDNIISIEIDGDFDDCQKLVKKAFLDSFLKKKIKLTSANSINIARWLAQMFYYCIAFRSTLFKKKDIQKEIIFSVPSGNFGNICAGIITERMGLSISLFIASTNVNDTIPRFMNIPIYEPKKAKYTLSNAMDVADPSNFIRILSLQSNKELLKNNMIAYKFTDEQTIITMQDVWEKINYMLDPHGSVSLLGLMKYLKNNIYNIGFFFETAHPIKFLDKIKESLRKNISNPNKYNYSFNNDKNSYRLSTKYEEFREFILDINIY